MAYLINGQPVNIRVEYFRADGVRYDNLLNPSVRAKLGVVETNDPDPFEPAAPDYDQRFYWGPNNPKQLEDLTVTPEEGRESYVQKGMKSNWIAQVKDTAGKMLAQTDWMVIRKAERNIDIPAEVITKRAAIVAECDRLEAAITATPDVESFIQVVTSQNWPSERI
jgi:hypothetical protein